MHFQVRALDEATQRVVTASLDALDEHDARAQLHARRLTPIELQPQRKMRWAGSAQAFSVMLFAQELHALVGAGLSLVESLEAFAEKERRPEARTVLERLVASLREGKRFSAALRAQGELFPPLFIGIVESAEGTGELAPALERYIGYAQRVQTVRQRMVSAAIYPAILLGVGGLVSLFLMGWVVPRFAAVYRSGGRSLPWGSELLLSWGQFVGQHSAGALAAVLGLVLVLAWWIRSVSQRGGWSQVAGLVPGVARWMELLTLSRLFLTLGLLLRGGLPIQQALQLSRSVLPAGRASLVDTVSLRVTEGWALSAALDEAGLSTPISSRFVRAGERSGQVAEMLHRAAQYHDAETERWLDRFSRIFEPALMAGIGLVIGVIVLLLYMPIFDLAGGVQ
ncbi:MAG TPA: type II secretion system F family protein [Rhizobacter sp.]|nr:type II secretion system F family protein [Rhizobacter sp.]